MSTLDAEAAPKAVIFGLAGPVLLPEEADFFRKADPLGFILFARNCETPEQISALTDSLRDCLGRDVPILIDQEGGRVARLKPPHWQERPAAHKFGDMFKSNFSRGLSAVRANAESIAGELSTLGINVNCAPVMDVLSVETHESIGDRAFSSDPEMVAALGAAICDSYLANGIIPVVKHIPGQGRAAQDSHEALPVVEVPLEELQRADFLPFKHLQNKAYSDGIWGMTAHVVYKDIDEKMPATASRRVIWDIIRGEMGFYGLLLSDDICMEALSFCGGMGDRARTVIRAGCDVVLHCNGNLDEMRDVAAQCPEMNDKSIKHYNRSAVLARSGQRKKQASV